MSRSPQIRQGGISHIKQQKNKKRLTPYQQPKRRNWLARLVQ